MKHIRQHDERDCGAACIAMIASYYKYFNTLEFFRKKTNTDSDGCSLDGIARACNNIGLSFDALNGTAEELLKGINSGEITFPFIAQIVSDAGYLHFVVVRSFKKGYLLIDDPGKETKEKISYEDFTKRYLGNVMIFSKTPQFVKKKNTNGTLKKFIKLLAGQKKFFIIALAFSIFIATVDVLGTFIFQISIDSMFYNYSGMVDEHIVPILETWSDKLEWWFYSNDAHLNIAFAALLSANIISVVFIFFRSRIMALLSKNIDVNVLIPYFNKLTKLPISELNSRQAGDYLSRFSDTGVIRDAIANVTLNLLMDFIVVIMAGVVLFFVSKTLFAISLISVLMYIVLGIVFHKPVTTINQEIMIDKASVESYMKEVVDGMETLKANQAELFAQKNFFVKIGSFFSKVLKGNKIFNTENSIIEAVETLGSLIILWMGFALVKQDELTIGSIMTFYALLSFFTSPFKNFLSYQPTLRKAVVAMERLNDIMDIQNEEDLAVVSKAECKNFAIDCKNLNFAYGNRENILHNISFTIRPGEKIGFVGESGSGKTTLAKLLLRFYELSDGQITIDNTPINLIDMQSLRSQIAYVEQKSFVFADSIKNNLLLGTLNASDEEINAVCDMACLTEFINRLPMGLDEKIDEEGKNLSEGQKQRIAIARALLRKPKILIFDEATSNLDTITESNILANISNNYPNLTCLFIAHRLSTVRNANRIYVLHNGQLIESGTHQELLAKNSYYSKLCFES